MPLVYHIAQALMDNIQALRAVWLILATLHLIAWLMIVAFKVGAAWERKKEPRY